MNATGIQKHRHLGTQRCQPASQQGCEPLTENRCVKSTDKTALPNSSQPASFALKTDLKAQSKEPVCLAAYNWPLQAARHMQQNQELANLNWYFLTVLSGQVEPMSCLTWGTLDITALQKPPSCSRKGNRGVQVLAQAAPSSPALSPGSSFLLHSSSKQKKHEHVFRLGNNSYTINPPLSFYYILSSAVTIFNCYYFILKISKKQIISFSGFICSLSAWLRHSRWFTIGLNAVKRDEDGHQMLKPAAWKATVARPVA